MPKPTEAGGGGSSSSKSPACDTTSEWYWLGFEQKLPVRPDQWTRYDAVVSYHLTASLNAMRMEGRQDGLVLDLATFTDPAQQYQVWRARPAEVLNPNEPELLGKLAIAGYSKDIWEAPKSQLPPAARHGKVAVGFYQIRTEHPPLLKQLNDYLADPSGPRNPLQGPPRRRVVLLIEIERPQFLFGNVDRFSRISKRNSTAPAALEAGTSDDVPPGEAVFQWWWGDPMTRWGHWKNYHPHVSARLERAYAESEGFRGCEEAMPIDDVRYMLKRISADKPFNYLDQNISGGFREVFLPEHVVTVDNPLYDQQTRLTNNCFVQFQRGNPRRRRPVRRVRRGEAAGLVDASGEPCGVCFSETGVLTGCSNSHIVCSSCLRMGLRVLVGDVTQTTGLVCGCLTKDDKVALDNLARRADDSLQALCAAPPESEAERREFDVELAQIQRAFQLAKDVPADIFVQKIADWTEKVNVRAMEHLYHACGTPGCSIDNWILRIDFEAQQQAGGGPNWTCKAGHNNCVLPSEEDIDEINRNILTHPEFYTNYGNSTGLRRFRLCPECVDEGLLTFAVHAEGCKQWPGHGGHRHVMCWICTRKWGPECSHAVTCADAGIQQVRRCKGRNGMDFLEVGFIRGEAYTSWIRGGPMASACPPTVFPGGKEVLGATRQGRLGMENKAELRAAMAKGTT